MDFANAVRVTVPKSIQNRGRNVFLMVATDVHRELTLGTHIDTGSLRASLAAATQGTSFPSLPARATGKGSTPKPMQFAPLWSGAQAQAASAIANAVRGLTKLVFAYAASYVRYTTTGTPQLVQRVKGMIPQFVRHAMRGAQRSSSSGAAD